MTRSVRYAIFVVAALSLAAPAVAQMPDYDTQGYCERLYPRSYSLQKICRDNEHDARRAFRFSDNLPTGVLNYCRGLYRESYSLLKICVENELDAKASLPPSRGRVVAPPRGNASSDPVIIMRGD